MREGESERRRKKEGMREGGGGEKRTTYSLALYWKFMGCAGP